jgi:hypothetical protein
MPSPRIIGAHAYPVIAAPNAHPALPEWSDGSDCVDAAAAFDFTGSMHSPFTQTLSPLQSTSLVHCPKAVCMVKRPAIRTRLQSEEAIFIFLSMV